MIVTLAGLKASRQFRREVFDYNRRFISMAKVLKGLPGCLKLILCQVDAFHGLAVVFWRDQAAIDSWYTNSTHQEMVRYAHGHLDILEHDGAGLWIEFFEPISRGLMLGHQWPDSLRGSGDLIEWRVEATGSARSGTPILLAVAIWDLPKNLLDGFLPHFRRYEEALQRRSEKVTSASYQVAPSGRMWLTWWPDVNSVEEWIAGESHASLCHELSQRNRSEEGSLWLHAMLQLPGGLRTSDSLGAPRSLAPVWHPAQMPARTVNL